MFQRPALDAGENGRVQHSGHLLDLPFRSLDSPRILEILTHQDHTAARAAQGFVGGRSNDMSVFHRIVEQPGGNQARRMRHVDHQQRAHFVGDLAHPLVIPLAAVRRRAADNHFRFVFEGETFHRIVIDRSGLFAQLVADRIVKDTRRVDRRTVRQMTAVRQIEPHKSIARLEHRQENGHVRLRSRVRLHVSVFGAVQLAQTVDGQLLHLIHHFATAVITRPRIPFGIFVSQHGTHRLHNLLAYKVLGSDQLDTVQLPLLFALDQSE